MSSRNYYLPLPVEVPDDFVPLQPEYEPQPDHIAPVQYVRYQQWVPLDRREDESLKRHEEELLNRHARAGRCNLCRWCSKLDLATLRHGRKPFDWDLFEFVDEPRTAGLKGYFGHARRQRSLHIVDGFDTNRARVDSFTASWAKPPGSGCPVCRIIRNICREIVPEKDELQVTLWLREPVSMCLHDCNNDEKWSTIDIVVIIGSVKRTVTLIPLLQPTEQEGPAKHNCMARHELPLVTNFGRLSNWINDCDKNHHHESIDHIRRDLPFLRVIDVKNRCLAQKPFDSKFAALSYTWGKCWQYQLQKDQLKMFLEPGSITGVWNELSKVVTDAITTCERLDIPYLWIDTLCIVDDDKDDKHHQIACMDQIYSSAYITLIAAAGSDANDGLPRVSKHVGRRTRLLNVDGLAYQLANASDWDSTDLDKSAWCTRGWTFQELVLSRRVLVFTPTEVFFYCSRGFQAESMHKQSGSNYESRFGATVLRICNSVKPQMPGRPTYSIWSVRNNYETVHWNLLNNYLRRDLSYDTDILNAFAGVLNAEGATLGQTFYGLPYKILARALFWELNNMVLIQPGQHYFKSSEFSMERRKQFPSWSWTGWKISENEMFAPATQKKQMLRNSVTSENFTPLIHIYHKDDLGHITSLMGERSETDGVEGFEPRHVELFNIQMQTSRSSQPLPLNTNASPSATHFQTVDPSCLIFFASCATFVVSGIPECRDQDHAFGLYKVFTEDKTHQDRTHPPRVWLNIEWREQQGRTLDFILVGVDLDQVAYGGKGYHAMLIKHGQNLVAERVAIPQPFTLDQWKYGRVSSQWIILG